VDLIKNYSLFSEFEIYKYFSNQWHLPMGGFQNHRDPSAGKVEKEKVSDDRLRGLCGKILLEETTKYSRKTDSFSRQGRTSIPSPTSPTKRMTEFQMLRCPLNLYNRKPGSTIVS
jgi:hypothetical protein